MIDLYHIKLLLKVGSIGGSVCLMHEQAADIHPLLIEVVGGDNVDFHGLFADVISIEGRGGGVVAPLCHFYWWCSPAISHAGNPSILPDARERPKVSPRWELSWGRPFTTLVLTHTVSRVLRSVAML